MINNTSEKYRAVARRGSLLFFIMNELSKIHTYYIYSLNAFVVVFQRGIEVGAGRRSARRRPRRRRPRGGGSPSSRRSRRRSSPGLQRFPWNHDILMDASHCADVGRRP